MENGGKMKIEKFEKFFYALKKVKSPSLVVERKIEDCNRETLILVVKRIERGTPLAP